MAGDLDFATSLLHQSSAYLLNSPSYQQQQPGLVFVSEYGQHEHGCQGSGGSQ
jgi:hypothetical protein